jgi:hypothetical protein
MYPPRGRPVEEQEAEVASNHRGASRFGRHPHMGAKRSPATLGLQTKGKQRVGPRSVLSGLPKCKRLSLLYRGAPYINVPNERTFSSSAPATSSAQGPPNHPLPSLPCTRSLGELSVRSRAGPTGYRGPANSDELLPQLDLRG